MLPSPLNAAWQKEQKHESVSTRKAVAYFELICFAFSHPRSDRPQEEAMNFPIVLSVARSSYLRFFATKSVTLNYFIFARSHFLTFERYLESYLLKSNKQNCTYLT